jgi:hypothetical protein
MPHNTPRTSGRSQNYKFDRAGTPTDFGPFSGEIMNNIDPTRQGRLQVYIKQFAGKDKTNKSLWRTVSYCPPFFGSTPKTSTSDGVGTYGSTNNQQSYGMWMTPPDVGVSVLCFFIAGDPNQGYYVGCLPKQGINHMVPAIGAATNPADQNANQNEYFSKSPALPVTEINNAPTNTAINESPQFFNEKKPVHSYVASALFQQGLINDPIRGSITSSSQRESPSTVYGISTPGRPIYQGGLNDATITQQVASGQSTVEDLNIVGRRGGHSFVMDDGDVSGKNALVRIRTATGHQITLSDDGNCLYICHANGQAWVELGQEGTLDVYTTNSINLRTQGTLNLHADKDININAGGNLTMLGNTASTLQSNGPLNLQSKGLASLYSQVTINVKTNGALALQSGVGAWNAGAELALDAIGIDLNGGLAMATAALPAPTGVHNYLMPDADFDASTGWKVSATKLKSVVTRAPSHEPWPYHNQGVQVHVSLDAATNSQPPGAPTLPGGFSISQVSSAVSSSVSSNVSSAASAAISDLTSSLGF